MNSSEYNQYLQKHLDRTTEKMRNRLKYVDGSEEWWMVQGSILTLKEVKRFLEEHEQGKLSSSDQS